MWPTRRASSRSCWVPGRISTAPSGFLTETAPNGRVRRVMEQLRDAVRDGAPLSAALGRHPRSFPRLYIGLVRAGEAGGQLASTLHHLADLLENERSLATTVTSALIYPALLIVAAIGSIALLLTQVLPQFVPLFQQNGAALPASTRFLIDAGRVRQRRWRLRAGSLRGAVRAGARGAAPTARAAGRRPVPAAAAGRSAPCCASCWPRASPARSALC